MLNPKTGKPWKVYVALPSNGTVCDFQNYLLREVTERYRDEVELTFPAQLCQRIFHDSARNGCVEEFLETDCEILWMIDSDIVPPKHVLDLVSMHGDKWQCAGAPYPIFMAQPGESQRQVTITAYKSIDPDPVTKKPRLAPCAVPDSGMEFVDGLATGCLFIKREIFEKLERPFFEFKYDPITRMPIEGEDIGFCLKMFKLGVKFFTDYSMVCKHYKNNIDLLEINNYAVQFAQKHIAAYKAEIDKGRGQLEEVAKRFQQLIARNKELEAMVARGQASRLVTAEGKPLIFR
jgi:hypothetical protein